MASWGGSSNGRGPDRSDSSLSGGSRGNDRQNESGGSSDRSGQGPARSNVNLSGGSRRDINAPQGNGGDGGNGSASATSRQGSLSMRASLAELNRRDRLAVAALGPDGRNVNVASDVFNDDEEGINSIGEAIGRFGSWVQDRFGAGAPSGFAKSDAANGLATAAGFMLGGPVGAGVTGGAHGMYSAAPGRPNTIGNVARMASGVPGPVGGIATIAGLIDSAVDLDEGIALDELPAGSPATAAAQSLSSVGLDDFPSGRQNDDPRIIAGTTTPSKAKTSAKSAVASNVARNKRRTFSPLNLRFAALRGVPTVEELL